MTNNIFLKSFSQNKLENTKLFISQEVVVQFSHHHRNISVIIIFGKVTHLDLY